MSKGLVEIIVAWRNHGTIGNRRPWTLPPPKTYLAMGVNSKVVARNDNVEELLAFLRRNDYEVKEGEYRHGRFEFYDEYTLWINGYKYEIKDYLDRILK